MQGTREIGEPKLDFHRVPYDEYVHASTLHRLQQTLSDDPGPPVITSGPARLDAVDPLAPLSFAFSEPIDRLTITKSTFIVERSGTHFDPEVVNVFQSSVAPYPPGSDITLSDGTSGIVKDVKPDKLTQPIVYGLVFDRGSQPDVTR